jgi:adenylate cyclase
LDEVSQGTVLFADVSGSTKLYETAGDAVGLSIVQRCVELFAEQTRLAGGRVVKTIGDAVLAVFRTPDAAARAALGMHEQIDQLPPVGESKIAVRIGFHHGPVMGRENDLFGDTVNLAARLVHVAHAGQTILSAQTARALGPELAAACRSLHAVPVKGKANEIEIVELLRQRDQAEATAIVRTLRVRTAMSGLRLRYEDVETVLDAAYKSFVLGRDRTADLVIEERTASRSHARIEHRAGKFVLVDHSANGTYVTVEGEPEMLLHREEFVLHGKGVIALGVPRANAVGTLRRRASCFQSQIALPGGPGRVVRELREFARLTSKAK